MNKGLEIQKAFCLPATVIMNRVVARRHPFSCEIVELWVPASLTVREIIEKVGIKRAKAVVQIDGMPLPADAHNTYVPPSGSLIVIRAVPKPPVIPLIVAVALYAVEIIAIETLIMVAISTAIALVMQAIAKPPKQPSLSLRTPELPGVGRQRGSRAGITQSPSLSGGRNQSNRYGPVPRILGRHKIIPPYGADPYTEVAGDEQYLRMLFVLGYGPLEISDMKIGDTPLANFTGVEYQVKQGYASDTPITLFSNDIEEQTLNIRLTSAGGWYTRTTSADTDEISFDITFPSGLIQFKESYEEGEDPEASRTVAVEYAYSVAGAGVWTTGTISTTAKRGSTIRKTQRISVETGRYDVRLRRTTADTNDSLIVDTVQWTALRSIHSVHPINMTGLALVAVRIKASDQLNGVVDTFNAVGASIIRDWNPGTSTWIERTTSNPASLYREVLQGSANKRALSDAQVDLDGLQDWHEFCTAKGFAYNQPIDFRSSVEDILEEIASAGRASPCYVNGKRGVVWERAQTIPRQHFTPRNSWGFSAKKTFIDMPHAFRVRFPNKNKDWQEDERVVYDDGYSEANATRFEQLELPGIDDSDLVWMHGRFHLAQARLRPETYTWNADVEHIVCTKGDLVRTSHDVLLIGIGWGRVKSVQDNGTHATGVTMDSIMSMVSGKVYCIRFRKADNSSLLCPVVTDPGDQTALVFETPVILESAPAKGDLGLFGLSGLESAEMIIKSIEPSSGLNARITAYDYSPAIQTADQGTIPEFNSQITLQQDVLTVIGTPIIDRIDSGESVLERGTDGVFHPRILIVFKYQRGRLFDQIAETQVDYRLDDSDGSWERLTFPNYVPQIYIAGVTEGKTYDIRIRYKIHDGRVSEWTSIHDHTVIGKTTPPPDVERLWVEGNVLRWNYATPPLDFAGFRVRHRAGTGMSWEDATAAHDGLWAGTVFHLDGLPKGTRTIMVKAEDVAGNRSTNAAVLVKDLGDPAVANVVVTEDFSAEGFPGTIENGTVNGTDLEADTLTLFWPESDSVVFWDADQSAVFWDADYLEMSYVCEFTPNTEDLPGGISLDYDIEGSPYEVLYRTAGGSLFWETPDSATFWGDDADTFWAEAEEFKTWPGKVDATRQKYEFKVVTGAGVVQGVIRDFAAKLDVPDLEELLDDVAIGSGGTRLPITETYRDITHVMVTLQDDGGSGIFAKVMDKSETGPLVHVFDVNGNLTSGLIDAQVQGY
jgi:sulfur carrier protein ThiS